MQADYLEIKLHKNKPAQQFRCTLLHREPGHAVLRYVSAEPGRIADISVAPGSTTIAHYRQDRPYIAWRMFDRTGSLIGTLFHICAFIEIHADHLRYEDLLLDIWLSPDGGLRVLDEDELQMCVRDGLVSNRELRIVRNAQNMICADYTAIIAEMEAFERTYPHALPRRT